MNAHLHCRSDSQSGCRKDWRWRLQRMLKKRRIQVVAASAVREGQDKDKSSESDFVSNNRTSGGTSVVPRTSSVVTIVSAFLQAGCLTFIALNGLRVWLGFSAVAAASGGSFIHSDPVRYGLAA